MLCFSLHCLFLLLLLLIVFIFPMHLPPALPPFQSTGTDLDVERSGLHSQPLKWYPLFPSPMLLWLFPLYMNVFGCAWELVNVIFAARCSALPFPPSPSSAVIAQTWLQWQQSLLETALLYTAEKGNQRPWQVCLGVSFLMQLCNWFSMGNVQFSKNKSQFYGMVRMLAAPQFQYVLLCAPRKLNFCQ